MAINTKRPPLKETVGAQYVCFQKDDSKEWTESYEEDVERTEVVKSVKVTENMEPTDVYASGVIYDTDNTNTGTDIEVEAIAFPISTLAKMRAENTDEGGLCLSGGGRVRPYFAYGKVVKFKSGKIRYEWYPKCKLSENSDDASTKEEKFSEQTETIKIKAYPFNEDGDVKAYVDSSMENFPAGLTEEKFFSKPVYTKELLIEVAGK